MRKKYEDKKISRERLELIEIINGIAASYHRRNHLMTVRQAYYQLIATAYDRIPDSWKAKDPVTGLKTGSKNNEKSYGKVIELIADARLTGLMDWDFFEDRVRQASRLAMWNDPVHRLQWAAKTHRLDKWDDQPNFVYVMVEKQALEGIFVQICHQLEVPFMSNHGYSSLSALREIGLELKQRRAHGQEIHIIYAGDHDPSGIQMTDDVKRRLEMFSEGDIYMDRIALNMDQVELYNPPPNPTKPKDSRTDAYEAIYGEECWELDALTPEQLTELIEDSVLQLRDDDVWNESMDKQEHERDLLTTLAERVRVEDVPLITAEEYESQNGKNSAKKGRKSK